MYPELVSGYDKIAPPLLGIQPPGWEIPTHVIGCDPYGKPAKGKPQH